MSRSRAILAAAGLLLPGLAGAHPSGIHKRDDVTVTAADFTVLVSLEIDSGKRAQLLRQGVDLDGDGLLSNAERTELRRQLLTMARREFALEVSGFRVAFTEAEEAKLSLREDPRASDAGLSFALLLHATHPKVTPGMELVVKDGSPDGSPALVTVFQAGADGGVGQQTQKEISVGEMLRVRLGQL
jgi:hypothetical protein